MKLVYLGIFLIWWWSTTVNQIFLSPCGLMLCALLGFFVCLKVLWLLANLGLFNPYFSNRMFPLLPIESQVMYMSENFNIWFDHLFHRMHYFFSEYVLLSGADFNDWISLQIHCFFSVIYHLLLYLSFNLQDLKRFMYYFSALKFLYFIVSKRMVLKEC